MQERKSVSPINWDFIWQHCSLQYTPQAPAKAELNLQDQNGLKDTNRT